MAAPNYANPDSLTELSTMLERTLIDTGRLFRKPASMPSKTTLQRSIPAYYESFQEALDNLSEQIFMAKAFLEKDYEAIKAQTAPQPVEDVVMGDAEPSKVKLEAEKAPVDDHPVEPKIEEQPAVAPTIPETHADTPIKEEKEAEPVPGEIDFDSVLNDNAGGPNDFDLNLDFGDDALGNQAFLSGSTFDKAKPPDGGGGGESLTWSCRRTGIRRSWASRALMTCSLKRTSSGRAILGS
ncbi:hypothetical protein N7474_000464 [Penicillium riverlandense]|uniref:uncharacterized protein n=1 Tax=Penicillium riverlandense TaxID=1903569 RepID=UPI002546AAC0|nr:uncharacterized protein N7474_000464 [Penicillium riverlandense]KAJ5832153.1 hypothetical protein N7474_000464 [Penicillium riverlandense]